VQENSAESPRENLKEVFYGSSHKKEEDVRRREVSSNRSSLSFKRKLSSRGEPRAKSGGPAQPLKQASA